VTYATHAQELAWANEDEAERKAVADMNYPDDAHQWPLDPSANPSTSDIEFYQKRGE
tara:strand:+ start:508 stop:678 length:171 start_codon:yes stop_codon:yes gene_type:complete